jgi:putative tryptophan/tyrosine transport system substrate-binding protein
MRRREFITLLGGAAAWPVAAHAQQPAHPIVGCIFSGPLEANGDHVAALRRGMDEAGFVEGRDVSVEYRWNYDYYDQDRYAELAADLSRRVAVIFTNTAGAALRVKAAAAAAAIPIIFVALADAVQVGLVSNLTRPGGNVTGVNGMVAEPGAKRIGLLHELLPKAVRFAVLVNPRVPGSETDIALAQAAAKTLDLSLEVFSATTNREIDAAFARAAERRQDALAIARSQLFYDRRVQLITLATHYALPAIFFDRSFVEVGGLMSYGPSLTDQFRQAGIYVGRILKGEKPGDLPVIQPTKFEFVINAQTAPILGIEVPPTLLAIVDEVID